jgi:hypothetical protein
MISEHTKSPSNTLNALTTEPRSLSIEDESFSYLESFGLGLEGMVSLIREYEGGTYATGPKA